MARMAMMGRRSVDYHAKTLGLGAPGDGVGVGLEPGVDVEPSAALRYYSSHGETPLVWGGSGAERLGLSGAVSPAQYEAVFAEGGAVDPTTGVRLVGTRRPGMEIVVSAQKSLAELGVIGRAEDMHAILSAETDATMAYLDRVTRAAGGRRGRVREQSATQGMIWVRTRHATSRAGDPSPHDHILVANVVEMADHKGGYKAPDTTVWRDHLHAATMVGRLASAAQAVELGYAIEADPGPSGKLGHWRLAGIPKQVEEVHSKRGLEINAALEESGFASWAAKEIAANETRPRKRHEPIADLVSRWHDELAGAGYPVENLSRMLDEANRFRRVPSLSWDGLRDIVDDALASEGPLGRRKVFSRPDAIVALAPALYGQDPDLLEHVVSRLIADPEVVPLVGVPGARDRAYTTARTLAVERAIADGIGAAMGRRDAPATSLSATMAAADAAEAGLGRPLTDGQKKLVHVVTGSGRGAELVVGVAGAGKTAALSAVRAAFESEGYTVIGTAMSGQAAATLGREAGIGESRTLASLNWRIEHGQLRLSNRHVVILDEVGTTDDPALLRLLCSAERARAKVVLVGDWRQLGPVGPGGAFEALLRRHKGAVQVLSENVRQRDRAEAEMLLALRSGSVPDAVDWCAEHGRIRTGATRGEAIEAAVAAWSVDVAEGCETMLLAWRRANVAALNARAREAMAEAGRLYGPELVVDGRRYRAGDRVVTLAPAAAGGELPTSTRAVVRAVDVAGTSLTVQTDNGRRVVLAGPDLARDHLDHGYATTVHRSQGATAERTHLLADGGGRELAYVGMSRAREASFAYVVAGDLDQAREDLVREWSHVRRPRWAVDLGTPGPGEEIGVLPDEPQAQRLALRRAYLSAQYDALIRATPQGVSEELEDMRAELRRLHADRDGVERGMGQAIPEEVRAAFLQLAYNEAQVRSRRLALERDRPRVFARRRLSADLARAEATAAVSRERFEALAEPHRRRLDAQISSLMPRFSELEAHDAAERVWLRRHPEAAQRFVNLAKALQTLEYGIENRRRALDGPEPPGMRQRRGSERKRELTAAERLRRRIEAPTPRRGMGLSR